MDRKEFLAKGFRGLGALSALTVLVGCTKGEEIVPDTTTTATMGSTNGSSASNCNVTPSETEGPFPTKNPSSLAIKNITGDRQGTPLGVNITVRAKSTGCGALPNATVDIWHCDADGNYSQYGGTGAQATNLTGVQWLRGRQTTDANGLASFQSIFPGWYSGRAVHIHVHVYDASGRSLLVTQIAFPAAICDAVFTTATNYYKKGRADMTNERDNVFSDGYSNELASLNGSVSEGFTLTHTIVVNA
jgi:protocatechuate 3,4-dioxygenase beta subunit